MSTTRVSNATIEFRSLVSTTGFQEAIRNQLAKSLKLENLQVYREEYGDEACDEVIKKVVGRVVARAADSFFGDLEVSHKIVEEKELESTRKAIDSIAAGFADDLAETFNIVEQEDQAKRSNREKGKESERPRPRGRIGSNSDSKSNVIRKKSSSLQGGANTDAESSLADSTSVSITPVSSIFSKKGSSITETTAPRDTASSHRGSKRWGEREAEDEEGYAENVYGSDEDNMPEPEDMATPILPPVKQLEADFISYSEEFIDKNFTGLFDKNSPEVRGIMETAAVKAKEIMKKYDLDPKDTIGLTKLALYDFAILCDDSSSMRPSGRNGNEDRVAMLKETLCRVAEIATLIEPSGISIRWLNYKKDSYGWDNLTSLEYIEPKVKEVPFSGPTRLGTVLDEKIVQPMVTQKMENGTFKKPLIVIIITDGEPTREDPNELEETIFKCKSSELVQKYGEATVVFVVSRVGSSDKAELFLSILESLDSVKDWVYCSADRIDRNTAVIKRGRDIAEANRDRQYVKKLLKLFLAALDQQTM